MGWAAKLLRVAPMRLWALISAGPPLTIATAVLVWLIWDNDHWPIDLRDKQLDFIGWIAIGCLSLVGVVIVTLAAVRVRGTGPGGTSIEIDADDDSKVTVTKEPS